MRAHFAHDSTLYYVNLFFYFILFYSDFTCVISMRYYVFNGFLSVQAFLP